MKDSIYKIYRLIHYHNAEPVLDIPALSFSRSSITGLAGPNGSGKTTLLKILGFILKPINGSIYFNGMPREPFSENVRHNVTLLPQEHYLMKRSVFDNIAYGLKIRKQTAHIEQNVFKALEMVGLSGEVYAQRMHNELSGGETQRVALAARLILKPEVLLLDEPAASVDLESSCLIRQASLNARDKWGTTLIIASHDKAWLSDLCDDIHHLFKGRIVGTGNDNIFFGPWRKRADGFYEMKSSGKQTMIVTEPPHDKAIAVIPSADVHICEDRYNMPDKAIRITGKIRELKLEKNIDNIIVVLDMGSFTIISKIKPQTIKLSEIHPGKDIMVWFVPDCIRWC